MSRVFVIADTHFGHKNILGMQPGRRPFATVEEHDQALVEAWNSVVSKRDTVWHLGDVFFTKHGHLPLAACNGVKHLVMGNHDHHSMAIYQQYFRRIGGATEYKGAVLTHIPVHPEQLRTRFTMNIHGHMHAEKMMCRNLFARLVPDPRYFCVSVESTWLAPVHLDSVLALAPRQRKKT